MLTYIYRKIKKLSIKYKSTKYRYKKKYNDWLLKHTPYFPEYLGYIYTLHLMYLVIIVLLMADSYHNLPPESFHPKN